jgi:hypothetical protein
MKYYIFHLYCGGYGETPEEGWNDCQNHFLIEQESMPETFSSEDCEEDTEKEEE